MIIYDDDSWDKWVKKYNPEKDKYGNPIMYETYGKDLEYVKSCNPKNIWTYGECDGSIYLDAGFHVVNRIGYYITEVPFEREVMCVIGYDNYETEDED